MECVCVRGVGWGASIFEHCVVVGRANSLALLPTRPCIEIPDTHHPRIHENKDNHMDLQQCSIVQRKLLNLFQRAFRWGFGLWLWHTKAGQSKGGTNSVLCIVVMVANLDIVD